MDMTGLGPTVYDQSVVSNGLLHKKNKPYTVLSKLTNQI